MDLYILSVFSLATFQLVTQYHWSCYLCRDYTCIYAYYARHANYACYWHIYKTPNSRAHSKFSN